MEAVQVYLLEDRPQLNVEVHQNGRELLSSAALERGEEGSSNVTFTLLTSLLQESSLKSDTLDN